MQIDGTEKYMHLNPGVKAARKIDQTELGLRDKQKQIEQSIDGVTLINVQLSHKIK